MTREDLFSKVKVDSNGCWIWQGRLNHYGYGMTKNEVGAHRRAWILFKGEINDGLFVCHKCDVRACCNPEHLFLGTQKDNLQDARRKGRMPKGDSHRNSRLTEAQISAILTEPRGTSQKTLALKYGVHQASISRVINGKQRANGS